MIGAFYAVSTWAAIAAVTLVAVVIASYVFRKR